MTDTKALVSAEELLQMPRGEVSRELIRGVLLEMEPGGAEHGAVAATAGVLLGAHVRANKLGRTYGAETGYVLESDPDTVRAPDASFVRSDRVVRTYKYFPGPPDFAVEVVSPRDSFTKIEAKVFQWLDSGCAAVLVLDPRRATGTVYRSRTDVRHFTGDEVVDLADAVDGWSVRVSAFFE